MSKKLNLTIPPLNLSGEMLIHKVRTNAFYFVPQWLEYGREMMDALFGDKSLLGELRSEKYDLMFLDIIAPEGLLLMDYLNIPSVGYSNFGFDNNWDISPPINPSYMPDAFSAYSEYMTFWERLINTVSITTMNLMKIQYQSPCDEAKVKYNLNTSLSLESVFTRLSLLIVNIDFVFDYPRPVFPWVKPVSGVLFHSPKPLPKELDQFVESSGDAGFIILSFGTLIPELTAETAAMVARVFARLPQKVIWRNINSNISGLGNNTKVLPWIPQNDLLGHPKARLFITHCGVSSSHEVLYHGVPVVAVPLFVDQFGHARKLVERLGMGEELDFFNFTESAFSGTVLNVLNNPKYFKNAKRAAATVRDQPMDGKEALMFWVEYAIRNNGSLHFHSQGMERLSWYQYLLLDVVSVLFSTVVTVVVLVYLICKLVCRHVTKKWFPSKRKNKTE
ncbi:UDP-glucuronosyltransferase 1-8 [Lingula anatina]|uniref:UDP-glucuronosyltransferase 1-8 n=1 Tax=Lingula anatina TaxID=7574 RepID=A0A1S3HVW4_LINAN|nr:UDP-glucuronosyltransferase 1-8 [Lingula anatina]|eukprot:XP_013389204.1 UDP-glucuronosyltransferase 1-8 [Lingula anatina]